MLSLRGSGGATSQIAVGGKYNVSPIAKFCITESQIITSLFNGVKLLIEAKDALPSNAYFIKI